MDLAPGNGSYRLQADGAARGNPGPAAFGYVIVAPSGEEVALEGEAIGTTTNNVAEYRALIAGLEAARRHQVERLRVCMDSELVVRQMTGEYRVKHAGLKPLNAEAVEARRGVPAVRFVAVKREDNARADQLVNETLDEKVGTREGRVF